MRYAIAMENFTDISYLKSLNIEPTYFGLGFIQLKLTKTRRMHFWHPDFVASDDYDTEWHDHRYSFSSQVLVGSITNHLAYSTPETPGTVGTHDVMEVCCEGNGAEFFHRATVTGIGQFTTTAGQSYYLEADTLHTVETSPFCATLQDRDTSREYKLKARVVCLHYVTSNPFGVKKSVDDLWKAIEEVLRHAPDKVGYHLAYIPKGELGEVSKIVEELAELKDAVAQDCRVMQLVEMSDMMGAMQAFLDRHHDGYHLEDLWKMQHITERAFRNGHR